MTVLECVTLGPRQRSHLVSRLARRCTSRKRPRHTGTQRTGVGPLNSLSFSIGRLVVNCKVEVRRSTSPRRTHQLRPRGGARVRPPGSENARLRERSGESAQEVLPAYWPTSVNFWESLDATEREALRSVASWRTFAAGARIMSEGERADHAMVILGGRAKICVHENGEESVLAVRGLGQLVGEQGALQVSVRSATVVALEMVWALVVQTKDFAAFITAHPRVLNIVEEQCYDRGTEGPAGYGVSSRPAATGLPGHRLAARYSWPRPQPLNGENCTICLSDVVGFGARTRTDKDRLVIREALSDMTNTSLRGIPGVWSEDRGDGLLIVVPPTVSTGQVLDQLLSELPIALDRHNSTQRASVRFQLRFAVNVGPIVSDAMGVSGEAIIVVARLVEAPSFKEAMARSTAGLGVIASPFVYETVIRHSSNPSDVASYSQVSVEVKESSTTAWMKLFDAPAPSWTVPPRAGPESFLGLLTRASISRDPRGRTAAASGPGSV